MLSPNQQPAQQLSVFKPAPFVDPLTYKSSFRDRALEEKLNTMIQLASLLYEGYRRDINVGFRTPCNIGVWLMFYFAAITDDGQALVRKEMAEKLVRTIAPQDPNYAVIQDAQNALQLGANPQVALAEQAITGLLNELTQPENLKLIVKKYLDTGGTAEITSNNGAVVDKIQAKLRAHGFSAEECRAFVKEDRESPALKMSMKTNIKFVWFNHKENKEVQCYFRTPDGREYKDVPMLEMNSSDHQCEYIPIQYKGQRLHALRLRLQDSSNPNGKAPDGGRTVSFIIPEDSKGVERTNFEAEWLKIFYTLGQETCVVDKDDNKTKTQRRLALLSEVYNEQQSRQLAIKESKISTTPQKHYDQQVVRFTGYNLKPLKKSPNDQEIQAQQLYVYPKSDKIEMAFKKGDGQIERRALFRSDHFPPPAVRAQILAYLNGGQTLTGDMVKFIYLGAELPAVPGVHSESKVVLTARTPLINDLNFTDTTLGVYEVFLKKNSVVGVIEEGQLQYRGIRAIKTDKKGGEIKNEETISVAKGGGNFNIPAPRITVEVNVPHACFVVYAQNNADYFGFRLCDPKQNLQLTNANGQLYERNNRPQLQAPVSSIPPSRPAILAPSSTTITAPSAMFGSQSAPQADSTAKPARLMPPASSSSASSNPQPASSGSSATLFAAKGIESKTDISLLTKLNDEAKEQCKSIKDEVMPLFQDLIKRLKVITLNDSSLLELYALITTAEIDNNWSMVFSLSKNILLNHKDIADALANFRKIDDIIRVSNKSNAWIDALCHIKHLSDAVQMSERAVEERLTSLEQQFYDNIDTGFNPCRALVVAELSSILGEDLSKDNNTSLEKLFARYIFKLTGEAKEEKDVSNISNARFELAFRAQGNAAVLSFTYLSPNVNNIFGKALAALPPSAGITAKGSVISIDLTSFVKQALPEMLALHHQKQKRLEM